jgi:RNA polymerase sigma-70 factor (ECF subfamily)
LPVATLATDDAPIVVARPEVGTDVVAAPRLRGAADDDLVERLRRGDRAAIARAYELHHDAVRGFARRLVGDPSAAEDIVHDAFVALRTAIRRFRGESSLRGFLIGVAANRAKRHIRSAMRARRAMARLAEMPVAGDVADPSRDLSRRRLADRLSAALDRLPHDQRVAFVLCEVEQRTSVDVSAMLGIAEGTVRTRVFHARRKLRDVLSAGGEDPRE